MFKLMAQWSMILGLRLEEFNCLLNYPKCTCGKFLVNDMWLLPDFVYLRLQKIGFRKKYLNDVKWCLHLEAN